MAEENLKKDVKEETVEKPKPAKPLPGPGPNIALIIIAILAFQALVAFLVIKVFIPSEKNDFENMFKNPEDTVKIEKEVPQMSIENEKILPVKAEATVNIAGTDGERFLRAKISIAYDEKDPKNKNIEVGLAKFETQIKSKITEYLSSLTLSDVTDRNAQVNIRTALLPELNAMIPSGIGQLSNVYIEEYIIQ